MIAATMGDMLARVQQVIHKRFNFDHALIHRRLWGHWDAGRRFGFGSRCGFFRNIFGGFACSHLIYLSARVCWAFACYVPL